MTTHYFGVFDHCESGYFSSLWCIIVINAGIFAKVVGSGGAMALPDVFLGFGEQMPYLGKKVAHLAKTVAPFFEWPPLP